MVYQIRWSRRCRSRTASRLPHGGHRAQPGLCPDQPGRSISDCMTTRRSGGSTWRTPAWLASPTIHARPPLHLQLRQAGVRLRRGDESSVGRSLCAQRTAVAGSRHQRQHGVLRQPQAMKSTASTGTITPTQALVRRQRRRGWRGRGHGQQPGLRVQLRQQLGDDVVGHLCANSTHADANPHTDADFDAHQRARQLRPPP